MGRDTHYVHGDFDLLNGFRLSACGDFARPGKGTSLWPEVTCRYCLLYKKGYDDGYRKGLGGLYEDEYDDTLS